MRSGALEWNEGYGATTSDKQGEVSKAKWLAPSVVEYRET
jgi:hypothetical protein